MDVALEANLRSAGDAFAAASRQAEEQRQRRNRLIQEAVVAGWTQEQIAEASGVSRSRIGQISPARRPSS